MMLEQALHKVALKPLYSHLYECMKTAQQQDVSLQRLQANQHTLMNRSLEELEGTAGAGVPDAAMLEKIRQHWATMHQQYSPQKKVEILLKVCKNIYHSMTVNAKPGECSRNQGPYSELCSACTVRIPKLCKMVFRPTDLLCQKRM